MCQKQNCDKDQVNKNGLVDVNETAFYEHLLFGFRQRAVEHKQSHVAETQM